MTAKPIFIVDGARTPFLKSRNKPGPFAASDLATHAGRALLTRQPFAPTDLDEVILGCASPSADEVNIGRVTALRMGCGQHVPGWTVMRNCASGMQALDSAIANMQAGRSNLVLAGGVDALSRAPLLFSEAMVHWLSAFYAAKTVGQKAAAVAKLKLSYLAPVIGIMKGLTDPNVGLLMGQTAENLAYRFGITRTRQDAFSARSHARVIEAQEHGWLGEIVPMFDDRGTLYKDDDGVRKDSTVENLAKLKPFFDRKYGTVTAGQQLADHRRRRVARPRHRGRREAPRPDADRPHRRLAMGGTRPGADGPRPGACLDADPAPPRLRPERHGLPGRSTRRSPPRCSAASRPGRATNTAASNWAESARWANSTWRSSTWTAAPSRSAIRSARRARASCCICCRCSSAQRPQGHGVDLHRRRPGRRHAGGAPVMKRDDAMLNSYTHWRLDTDADGLALAHLRQGRTNRPTRSRKDAMDEFGAIARRPRGARSPVRS